MTDYNLIDRITAIHLELENETSNPFTILIAVRNILNQSDGMSYPYIRSVLLRYYQLNPVLGINSNLINLVTSPNANTNNSINYMLLNQFNNQNLNNQPNEEFDNDEDLLSDNSSETTLSCDSESEGEDEDEDEDSELNNNNNNHENSNNTDPLLNYFSSQELPHYTTPINLSANNLNDIFTNFHNTTLSNTGFIPFPTQNNSNVFNNLFSFSNSLDMNLNDMQFTNNIANLFNTPLNSNQNTDIPIVITDESFEKLKKCKYVNIDDDIKKKNPKCMITLEDFKDDDEVILLPCEHAFCKEEATDWLQNNSYKCPICRHPSGNYYAKI